MKKLMILLVFALILTTSTLLYANSDKDIDKVPSGSPKAQNIETGITNTQNLENLSAVALVAGTAEKNTTESPAENPSDLKLNNGFVLLNHHQMSLIEDDLGNRYTFESLDFGKEAREAEEKKAAEAKAAEKAEEEAKAAEASKDQNAGNEGPESKNSSSITASKATANSGSAGASNAASATKSGSETKSTAEITTVVATPPKSPNVPSYSMNSVGIYHNDQGAVTVVYPNASQKRLKVLVEKSGERSAYNLHDGTKTANAVETYPLQHGDGTYLVRIMENTEGNSYREVYRKEVTLKSQQKHAVFLNSIQEINWSASDPAVQKAAQLTAGMSSEREKVRAVYNYVVRNVKYDHDKVNQLTTFYLPNINTTYSTNKGICYDYASLFAAMLRSQGIPTRMVKGYSDAIGNGEVYHAWNEVYLASEDRWVIIDTTHDAPYVQGGQSVDMIKGSGGFSVTHRL